MAGQGAVADALSERDLERLEAYKGSKLSRASARKVPIQMLCAAPWPWLTDLHAAVGGCHGLQGVRQRCHSAVCHRQGVCGRARGSRYCSADMRPAASRGSCSHCSACSCGSGSRGGQESTSGTCTHRQGVPATAAERRLPAKEQATTAEHVSVMQGMEGARA